MVVAVAVAIAIGVLIDIVAIGHFNTIWMFDTIQLDGFICASYVMVVVVVIIMIIYIIISVIIGWFLIQGIENIGRTEVGNKIRIRCE